MKRNSKASDLLTLDFMSKNKIDSGLGMKNDPRDSVMKSSLRDSKSNNKSGRNNFIVG